MFGVEADAPPKLTEHPRFWPGVILLFGAAATFVALVVFGITGIVWFAPLIAGPNLMLMGLAGLFLPGVTAVIGFDWNGYERWQLALGVVWLLCAVVLPLMGLALLMILSLLTA